MPYANKKGADQCSLISACVVRWPNTCSVIPLVSISKISSLYLVPVAEQTGFSLNWSKNPKDRLSRDEAHMMVTSSKSSSCSSLVFTLSDIVAVVWVLITTKIYKKLTKLLAY